MKKFLKVTGFSVLGSILLFLCLLGFSLLPAVSKKTLPPGGVIKFETAPLPDDHELKVITYNIGYASGEKNNRDPVSREEIETNLQNMVKALLPLNADVIGLQEVDFRASRTYDIDQLEYLAKELHLPYAAYVVTWNKNYVPWPYWPPRRHFGKIVSGQAILSRYPIADHSLLRFEKPRANPFWYNWFYPEKIAERITIDIEGKKGTVWNIHLEAFKPDSRLEQAEILGHEVMKHPSDIVLVAGDFNSPTRFNTRALFFSEIIKMRENQKAIVSFSEITLFRNAEKKESFYSIPSWKPIRKIDHIYYNEGVKMLDAGNLMLTASDHLPVWATFEY